MSKPILVEREGGIITVILNRPDKLNAFTKDMWALFGVTIRQLNDDDTVRCIVLRGAGEQAFSPGNDIFETACDQSSDPCRQDQHSIAEMPGARAPRSPDHSPSAPVQPGKPRPRDGGC